MLQPSITRAALGITATVALSFALAIGPAEAQSPSSVIVRVGKTVTVPLPRQPQRINIEDSSVASMEVIEGGKVKVTGKKAGKTRIIGRDNAQVPIIIEVVVKPPKE